MMNAAVPSPSLCSNSLGDSQESSNMSMVASPMSLALSPHQLICMQDTGVDDMVGLPALRIREEPVEKFRFRYKSEMMGMHGSILGRNSPKNRKKSYPSVELVALTNKNIESNVQHTSRVTAGGCGGFLRVLPFPSTSLSTNSVYICYVSCVQLCNYDGPAIIRCSLYTAHPDESLRTPHTHRLVVRVDNDEKDDPHEIYVSQDVSYHAVFQGMGIIHTAKKHVTDELVKKKRARYLEIQKTRNINITSLSMKEEAQIRHDAEQEAKKMNLNSVSLCFEAFQQDANGFLHSICKPVFSKPINNMKSALTGELKICRIDKHVSSCMGGEEVFILVEKVGKKNIKIRFFEVDDQDNEIWSDFGKFSELDVHHQYAIVFRTPPYRDLDIDNTVEVFMQLYRPTDGYCSEPIKFAYKPSEKIGRSRKRQRSSLENTIPVVIETDQRNFVNNTFDQVMDTHPANPMRESMANTLADPVLTTDHEDILASFEQILNESTEENGLNSKEFKDFMKNLSLSELKWIQTRPGVWYLGSENGRPANNIVMDPACGGFIYRIPTDYGVKMEQHVPSDYVETFERNENMLELTTDGPRKKPVKKYVAAKFHKTPTVDSTIKKVECYDAIKNNKREIHEMDKPLFFDSEQLAKKAVAELNQLMQKKPPPCEVTEKVTNIFAYMKSEGGDCPLHTAIVHDQKDHLKQMLTVLGRGSYAQILNFRNYNAETPLHMAVQLNQPDSVKALLAIGADPNAVNRNGDTALHLAVEISLDKCISELLDKSNYILNSNKPACNIRNYKGWYPLHLAALAHSLPAIQQLVDAGADVNVVDSTYGSTVLHIAAEEGDREITQYLVKQTAIDVNLANYSGNTALHVTCVVGGEGSYDIAKLLVDYKADPHQVNFKQRRKSSQDSAKEDETPLDFVEVKQEPESDDDEGQLKINDDYEDDVDDEDDTGDKESQGQTSFDLAINKKEILELLQKVEQQAKRRSKSLDVVEVKEEMCVSPISEFTLPEDNGLFDEETLLRLCEILDKSKGWVNLADLSDYGFIVPYIQSTTSPSKLLFNYADLDGSVTVQDIRCFLEALDEHEAVEVIDLMLAQQIATTSTSTTTSQLLQ